MNRVYERSQRDSSAKFYYSSQKLFREVKAIKLTLYLLSMVPIILSFTPVNEIKIGDTNIDVTFVATMIAFLLNIIAELASNNLCSAFVVGTDIAESKKALELANKHQNIYAIIGLYPEYAEKARVLNFVPYIDPKVYETSEEEINFIE